MKASRRLDRPVCGVVLSSGLRPAPRPVPCRLPARRPPPPAQCLHSQTRSREPTDVWPFGAWTARAAGSDPASGTLLPLLCPSAWRGTAKKSHTPPTRRTAPLARPARCLHDRAKQLRHFATAQPRYNFFNASAAPAPAPEPAEPAAAEHHIPPASPASFAAEIDSALSPDTDPGPWRPQRRIQTQEELLSFVDPPQAGDTVDEHLEYIRDPYMRRYAEPSEPRLLVQNGPDDDGPEYPTWKDLRQSDASVQGQVHALNNAVWRRLHNPQALSAAQVYDQYRLLPGSRMAVIPATLRHRLFKALAMVEKKNVEAMLRYFAVVADARDCGFPLWRAEWNSAMSFAGRYVGDASTTEMEAAMQLWREMERDMGIPANDVTFNILFDVASKAGNFTLAEMLYLEMEKRRLPFNRYHCVSLIHLFGLKMDADGVRAAYREMVMVGEMVDVTALNAVIAGFLRSGEESAADRVYRKMFDKYRSFLAKRPGTETQKDAPEETFDRIIPLNSETPNFASFKLMTDVLSLLAKVSRKDAGLREAYQFLVPTRPDLGTYRILIIHHAVRVGDMTSVVRYLNDMKVLRIPLHGSIFLALFKGFAIHGGQPGTGTMWSERRLRSIWAAFLRALDDKVEGLYISNWMMIWSLRAFGRCSTPEMVFKAYNSLTLRWQMSEEEIDFSITFLHQLLRNPHYHNYDYGEKHAPGSPWHGRHRDDASRESSVLGSLGNQSFSTRRD